jgi:hypothetical protein
MVKVHSPFSIGPDERDILHSLSSLWTQTDWLIKEKNDRFTRENIVYMKRILDLLNRKYLELV